MTWRSSSGWTVETVLAHLLALREADTRAVEIALVTAREATTKAESAATTHFAVLNGFREVLSEQQKTFVTRREIYTLCGLVGLFCGLLGGAMGHFYR
jgi:hypothetical protein